MQKVNAMRRKSTTAAAVEFNVEIDATAFERVATTLGTKVEGSWTSKSIEEALIAPLFTNLNKELEKHLKLTVNNIHELLANGEPVEISTKVSEFSSEDGPIMLKLVLGTGAPTGGTVLAISFEADPGFAHMALPEPDAELTTTLTPRWLKRTLKAAVLSPLLDNLNQGVPKGSKLTLDHISGILADGHPVEMTQKCLKLMLPAEGEPIHLTIKVGPARQHSSSGGSDEPFDMSGEEPAPKFSTRKKLQSRASMSGMRMITKVSGGGTFHILAGNIAVQAYVPKKALKKSLQDALIDPFLHSLKKKNVGLAQMEAFGGAKIEVDGVVCDPFRPASEYVMYARKDQPVVVILKTGAEEEEEEKMAEVSLNYHVNYEPVTPMSPTTPATPSTPTTDDEGENTTFGTMNSAAVARAKAAARARAKARITNSGEAPLLIEGLGGEHVEKV